MSVGKAVRSGVAATLLATASPALASDFSGVGRVMLWGIVAILVLISLLVTLFRRLRKPGEREGEVVVSVMAAVVLAPAGLVEMSGQWLPMPFPGAGVVMAEGDIAVLFPGPILSMALCGFGLLRLFTWLRARHERKATFPSSAAAGQQDP